MEKECSYLFERNYKNISDAEFDEKLMEYWKQIIGSDILDPILEENINFKSHLKQDDFEIKGQNLRIQKIYGDRTKMEQVQKKLYLELIKDDIYFPQFYVDILEMSEKNLREDLEGKEQFFSVNVFKDFVLHLARQLQMICIRILIAQMHLYQQREMLRGKNSKEEYEYFCEDIVGKEEFVKETFEQYPVLERCLADRIEYLHQYYIEVIENFQNDKKDICERFSWKKDINTIIKISGGNSDLHHQGKQVLKITFDSGEELLYKPRSMKNEEIYQDILKKISESVGITQYEYLILSYKTHSWCSIVQYASCISQEQLENYYKRLGVHLFVTYLLGTKDLHCENMIAVGQYPVLIDLEALIHMKNNQIRVTAEQEVRYQVSQSVLLTGLLPFYMWNQDGKGINISAISGGKGQEYPFKIPVIDKGGTSEMCITYKRPCSKEADNLAKLKGEFIEPGQFVNEIIEGFCKAYQHVTNGKDGYRQIVEGINDIRSRILVADTQRYSMLLSASYHPDLMHSGADRELFLCSLWRGRDSKDKNIVETEIRNLLFGDIPYFYVQSDEKAVFCGNLKVYDNYFKHTAKEQVFQKLDGLCKNDEEKQCEYIRVSLELAEQNKDKCMNRVYFVNSEGKKKVDTSEKIISQLTERLLRDAVWNQERTEVNWAILRLTSKGFVWEINAMDIYLYDGLAGMLLLMYVLKKADGRRKIVDMYEALQNQLFNYTLMAGQSLRNLQTKNTGAYTGEGSIVYTYLLLYELSGENEYLVQAKRHTEIVVQLLDDDLKFDILAGNAGAAQVFLKLYDITSECQYLSYARYAIEVLQKSAIRMNRGIGWIVEKGMPPMAGIAHGNSGILMPIVSLWRITGEKKYEKMAKEIWLYEDNLYNEKTENWIDMREENESDDSVGNVAWCHGIAGILLSRVKCYLEVGNCMDDMWKEKILKDISRAHTKLRNYWKRDSWCLCHGSCGNLWVLKYVNKVCENHTEVESGVREEVPYDNYLLPQERINPGMMNGYGGILYYLLFQEGGKIFNIMI